MDTEQILKSGEEIKELKVKTVEELMQELYGEVDVIIRGITPLLMNRPVGIESKEPKPGKDEDLKEQAERSAYRIEDGSLKGVLYIPNSAIYGSILNAASSYRSGRKSFSTIFAGTIKISPEQIPIFNSEGELVRDYEVDIRPVNIKGHGKVPRGRAKIADWAARFSILYDKKYSTPAFLKTLKESLIDAGRVVGILDFRPQHRGWFGTFVVVKFEVVR